MKAIVASIIVSLCVGPNVAVVVNGDPGPITKVVELLQTMQKELEVEAKEDKETYEKLKCWCETNDATKTQAVKDQKQEIDELNAAIEGATAKKAELSTEVEQLKKNIAEAKQALAEATEIRKKEAAEFAAEEKELSKSIVLLKGAIVALSKHHTGLLQSDSELMGMRPALRKLVHQNLRRLGFLTVAREKDAFLSFLNANDDILESDAPVRPEEDLSFMQIPVFKSYAPQSGQIYGILQQMKEAFEEDLPQIQKEEVAKQQAFALLKGEKESEIKEYQDSIETKEGQLATTKEDLVAAKSDLKDVKASLSADEQFLLELTKRCTEGDYEWERRQKLRSEEIEAVAQAIVILSTDKVKDGQQTTFRSKEGFLQVKMGSPSSLLSNGNSRREKAVALLNKAVAKAPGLIMLLASAKSDPFEKVIKAIDELLAKLQLEMADEVKHKDFCVNELNDNTVTTEKKQYELDTLETLLQTLGDKKKKLEETIATLKKEIAETRVQMQRAAEDRKMENAEFQRVVADNINTIHALKAANEKLSAFYFKNSNLVQVGAVATTTIAPTPEFEDYKSNRNSNKVMNMIQKLIGDAQVIKDDAVSDEQNAVNAYVKLVGESNDSIKAKSRAIVDTTEELAETEQAISQATLTRDETMRDLESLAATKASLHAQCDFLLKNFDLRQKARSSEMDALGEVKAILRGMK